MSKFITKMTEQQEDRAGELGAAIRRAYFTQPAGVGTKIETKAGDWEIIVDALMLYVDFASTMRR